METGVLHYQVLQFAYSFILEASNKILSLVQAVSVLNVINIRNTVLIVQLTTVLSNTFNYCVAAEGEIHRKCHYSHNCAASEVAPAQVSHALSVPAPACSEFETQAGSSSQASLPEHAAPAPPVQWTHSTLNNYTLWCFTFLFMHNGTLFKVCAVADKIMSKSYTSTTVAAKNTPYLKPDPPH
jgi:hypothetical protein